jgi:hypothetical protein
MDSLVVAYAMGAVGVVAGAALGARFLVASGRLGGLAPLRLLGLGFLALAGSSLLLPGAVPLGFSVYNAGRVVLQVLAFSAIALGYLLQLRHAEEPHPGWDFAYQAFLVAAAVALAPFALVAALHPLVEAVDEGLHAFCVALAGGVAWRLLRPPLAAAAGRSHRRLVALGFALLAVSQVVLAVEALEIPALEPGGWLLVGGDAIMVVSLLVFGATVLADRREEAAA